MRIISSVVVAALVGVLVGAALAYVDVRSDPDALGKLVGAQQAKQFQTDNSGPRVDVPEPVYHFGTMQRGTTKSHDFIIRNVGKAPLKLQFVSVTCKCTHPNVPEAPIPPGGSATVKLEWAAKSDNGPFTQ